MGTPLPEWARAMLADPADADRFELGGAWVVELNEEDRMELENKLCDLAGCAEAPPMERNPVVLLRRFADEVVKRAQGKANAARVLAAAFESAPSDEATRESLLHVARRIVNDLY